MKILKQTFVNKHPVQDHIYIGHDVTEKSGVVIELNLNGQILPFDLKRSVERNILLESPLGREELFNIAKAFDVKITIYPSGNISSQKIHKSHPETGEVYFGIINSNADTYLVSFYYFERQPTVYLAAIDKVYQIAF